VEVAKVLGGSFELVTLVPETAREMTQLPKETQKNRDRQTNQKAQMNTRIIYRQSTDIWVWFADLIGVARIGGGQKNRVK